MINFSLDFSLKYSFSLLFSTFKSFLFSSPLSVSCIFSSFKTGVSSPAESNKTIDQVEEYIYDFLLKSATFELE